jgi:hypothetical protein
MVGWHEGFNTFINSLSSDNFNHGEYKSKYPADKNRMANTYTAPSLEPILSYVDNYKERNNGTLSYSKPGEGLTLLRESHFRSGSFLIVPFKHILIDGLLNILHPMIFFIPLKMLQEKAYNGFGEDGLLTIGV